MLEAMISYYTKGNKSKFAAFLGVSAQTISSWVARNTFDLELIYAKCSNISAKWLLTGEGDMITNQDQTPYKHNQTDAIHTSEDYSPYYSLYKEEKEENRQLIRQCAKLEEKVDLLAKQLKVMGKNMGLDLDPLDVTDAITDTYITPRDAGDANNASVHSRE